MATQKLSAIAAAGVISGTDTLVGVQSGTTDVQYTYANLKTFTSASPALVTPALGTPASGVATNLTGTAAGLTAGNVTTNANLTGPITSVGNATSIASQTGTGTKFVVDTSPTLITPNLGTPSTAILTNATGLPVSTGVSGLGTGVATALAANTNATGGVVLTTVPPTAWTPTDQSGASLSFTAVSAQYCQYGNIVFAYGTLTYPATADASAAKISLPVAVPNQPYAAAPGLTTGAANDAFKPVPNSSTAALFTIAGVAVNNVTVSTKTINFLLIYPAS